MWPKKTRRQKHDNIRMALKAIALRGEKQLIQLAQVYCRARGNLIWCLGCGKILPISYLRKYELPKEVGWSHCCNSGWGRNQQHHNHFHFQQQQQEKGRESPPSYVQTSWDQLEENEDLLLRLLKKYKEVKKEHEKEEN